MLSTLGDHKLAARNYERAGDRVLAAESLLAHGAHAKAVDMLLRAKAYPRAMAVIERHPESFNKGKDANIDQRVLELLRLSAVSHHKREDTAAMMSALKKLPLPERVAFLEQRGYVDEVVQVLAHEGEHLRAAEVLAGASRHLDAARGLQQLIQNKDF